MHLGIPNIWKSLGKADQREESHCMASSAVNQVGERESKVDRCSINLVHVAGILNLRVINALRKHYPQSCICFCQNMPSSRCWAHIFLSTCTASNKIHIWCVGVNCIKKKGRGSVCVGRGLFYGHFSSLWPQWNQLMTISRFPIALPLHLLITAKLLLPVKSGFLRWWQKLYPKTAIS